MTTATLDPLQPQAPGGLRAGAMLALLAHGGLIAALVWGLNWRAQAPETVSAELWAVLPQQAAPKLEEAPAPVPAPEPRQAPPPVKAEPAPPDPQIAIERERRKEREKKEREAIEARDAKKAQDERAVREAKEAKEKKAAEALLARQREANLERMMGQIGASGPPSARGSAAQDAAPSRGYAGRLIAHIKPNIVFTESVAGNPAAEVEVRAAPSGTIVARRLVKTSGSKEWDEAVLRAIDRTGTLPKDIDGRVPSLILVAFRPQE